QGDGVTELRAGACNARLEATDPVAGAAIAARLIVEVAHQADLELLGQKPRRAPVQMDIDAALIFGGGIDEVVSQSSHRRKFISRLFVEIGVAGPAVQRAVPDADIREAGHVVDADRNIAGQVGHDVVDTGMTYLTGNIPVG